MITPEMVREAAEADVREGDQPFCRWCGRDWFALDDPLGVCPKAAPKPVEINGEIHWFARHDQIRP